MLIPHSRGKRLTEPSEVHLRILRAVAASATPLRSAELARHVSLFTREVRAACRWLQRNGYIQSSLKRVPQFMGNACALRLMAFWSITERGRQHLGGLTPSQAQIGISSLNGEAEHAKSDRYCANDPEVL